ncbi:MAG: hypothetical protein ABIH87_00680 [bacterium]
MKTLTKTKAVTSTKMAVATLTALAAGGVAFFFFPPWEMQVQRGQFHVLPVDDVYCVIIDSVSKVNTTTPSPSYAYATNNPFYGKGIIKESYGAARGIEGARERCHTFQSVMLNKYCSSRQGNPVPAHAVAVIYEGNSHRLKDFACVEDYCTDLYCP